MLPLIVIIYMTYDLEHVHSIIKNVPRGLFAIVVYSVCVSFAYPAYGIYLGTLVAYLSATVYLFIITLGIRPGKWGALRH